MEDKVKFELNVNNSTGTELKIVKLCGAFSSRGAFSIQNFSRSLFLSRFVRLNERSIKPAAAASSRLVFRFPNLDSRQFPLPQQRRQARDRIREQNETRRENFTERKSWMRRRRRRGGINLEGNSTREDIIKWKSNEEGENYTMAASLDFCMRLMSTKRRRGRIIELFGITMH